MNICVLSDKYPPHNAGGAGVIAANLAEGYAKRGHDVMVVTAVEDPEDAGRRHQSGVTIEAVHVRTFGPLRPYYSIYNPFAVPAVAKILDENEFDLVHAHNLHQYLSYYTITLAKSRGLPVVLTAHDAMSVAYGKLKPNWEQIDSQSDATLWTEGNDKSAKMLAEVYKINPWEQFKRRKIFYFPLRNRLNRRYLNDHVDVTVAVSNSLRRGLSVNGVRPDRVIYNGIDPTRYDGNDTEKFRAAMNLDDQRIILFSSRPEYFKGGLHLARAFRHVTDSREDVVLVVTGFKTAFLEQMQEHATPYSDRVIATGWLDDETLRAGYEAASIVVTPSLYLDPFPTVNLEAMAARTPVVATCFGGSNELVVDGKTGIVTDPRDVASLAKAMAELLDDPERRYQYGENGRARIDREFTLARQVEQYIELFDRVDDLANCRSGAFPMK